MAFEHLASLWKVLYRLVDRFITPRPVVPLRPARGGEDLAETTSSRAEATV